jgi:hypothetical protein
MCDEAHAFCFLSRNVLRPIARTRELAFPGPKLRSELFEHAAHVSRFIRLINMIRRYVETTYSLDLGPAQVTQLNRAISNGAEKGTFYLPKGMSITATIRCLLTFSAQVFLAASNSLQRLLPRVTTPTLRR